MIANRHLTIVTLLVTAFLLTACATTKSDSADRVTQNDATTDSVTETPARKKTVTPYQVPSKERHQKNYQKSGLLRLPGQFAYDKAGTKLTLKKTQTLAQTTRSNGLKITVTGVKVISNQAKTRQAMQMAEQALNLAKIPNPYQTIQLKFKITNLRTHQVLTDGIKTVQLNGGSKVSSVGGLSDSSAGKAIPAKTSHTFTAMLFAGPPRQRINRLTIQFSGSFSSSGTRLAPQPTPISISLT